MNWLLFLLRVVLGFSVSEASDSRRSADRSGSWAGAMTAITMPLAAPATAMTATAMTALSTTAVVVIGSVVWYLRRGFVRRPENSIPAHDRWDIGGIGWESGVCVACVPVFGRSRSWPGCGPSPGSGRPIPRR